MPPKSGLERYFDQLRIVAFPNVEFVWWESRSGQRNHVIVRFIDFREE